ncbi:hypothetical protein SAMN05421736_12291 [Evansella caseinilytica]|uniref:DUF4352 domain-containing protein n=1 Tax=Evansella caseinilytica TaxID=1503961 RepID=A0A1H3UKE4_9BACI|nr:hypothetical protein [Evansella caseinilytica]SDZ62874.1 hypothetical protein SAMN05421736_12291 [Evansella caseinilytica]
MKKLKFVVLTILLASLLAACGEDASEDKSKDEPGDETSENNTTEDESTGEETTDEDGTDDEKAADNSGGEDLIELNMEIADNDNFKATLVSIERSEDSVFGEKIEIKFDVENKRDETIVFQARDVSIDGRMVDDSLIFMSTEVASGKAADAVLTLQDVSDGELPAMENDFEMLLHVLSWDDFDFQEQAEVSVTFE